MTNTPRLSNEWLIRLLFAASSCIGTGGGLYATQWWAFLKDSPSRAEMDQRISEKVNASPWIQERPVIVAKLENISNALAELKVNNREMTQAVVELGQVTVELKTLIKKEVRP